VSVSVGVGICAYVLGCLCASVIVNICVRACVRSCVRACVHKRECVRCVHACYGWALVSSIQRRMVRWRRAIRAGASASASPSIIFNTHLIMRVLSPTYAECAYERGRIRLHPVHPTSIAARAAPSESRQLPRIISRARLRDSDADLGRRRRSRSPHWQAQGETGRGRSQLRPRRSAQPHRGGLPVAPAEHLSLVQI
jgi:hypothetical protein